MKMFLIVALLLSPTLAKADCMQWGKDIHGNEVCMADDLVNRNPVSPILGSGTITITAAPRPPTYTYDPKPDITARELSLVIEAILPALSCRNILGCGDAVLKKIEVMPPEVKRHFVRHEN